MHILIVEDDYLQADWLRISLEQEFPEAHIDWIETESKFRSCITHFINEPPDIILMDVMLRWADTEPNLQMPPKDVRDGGLYRAGLRCLKLLAEQEGTRNIPVSLYTVLEVDDLKPELKDIPLNIVHFGKANIEMLFRQIRGIPKSKLY